MTAKIGNSVSKKKLKGGSRENAYKGDWSNRIKNGCTLV